ncbi:hypothetical protein PFISCL1PPCAC_19046 [Pristionchus fissidentatus]|uniref:Uncharacterized protein n=1 Tax=Pristionchus fissidentatus TaxID=1538716 RepID=A0AAV5WAI2_9BILA|nr:hypothetical protein PFISCL1PPCAC_19046 [Pristionchus fissidentatus]
MILADLDLCIKMMDLDLLQIQLARLRRSDVIEEKRGDKKKMDETIWPSEKTSEFEKMLEELANFGGNWEKEEREKKKMRKKEKGSGERKNVVRNSPPIYENVYEESSREEKEEEETMVSPVYADPWICPNERLNKLLEDLENIYRGNIKLD